ncbi:MAG: type IV toxin-antitoxin system AbiEi family antitoxin domain-containing protein [Nitrososphaerales archaeon]
MQSAYTTTLEPEWLEKFDAELSHQLPIQNLKLTRTSKKPGNGFGMRAIGQSGEEYFIEINRGPLNRLDLGRALDQSAMLLKKERNARIVLVSSIVDPSVRDLLNRVGIRAFTFSELKIEKPPGMKPRETQLRLSPIEQQSYFALLRAGKKVIATKEFQLLLRVPEYSARNTLAALCRHGVLFRLGRGKYSVLPADIVYERKSYTADPMIVLDSLMEGQEYYVAYGSAAHIHGVATQIPLTTFVAVTRQRRQIGMGTTKIRFVNVKRSRFFGGIEREHFGSRVFVADLEKTMIDCFDRSDLVGGIESATRMLYDSIEKLDFSKLVDYTKRMRRNVLIQRLGFVLEKLQRIHSGIPDQILQGIENAAKIKFTYLLDPNVLKNGTISMRWRIYENVDCLRWYHA